MLMLIDQLKSYLNKVAKNLSKNPLDRSWHYRQYQDLHKNTSLGKKIQNSEIFSESFCKSTLFLIYLSVSSQFLRTMLTHWLPTASILVAIGIMYRYQFKLNFVKNEKTYCCSFRLILESTLNFKHSGKNELHSLSISDIIESERRGYLSAWKVLFLKTLQHSTW